MAKRAKKHSILPPLTLAQQQATMKAMDRKHHAEYLCFMMLQALNGLGLRSIFERAMKAQIITEEQFQAFFGEGEEAGVGEAGGYTVETLLDEWREATGAFALSIAHPKGKKNG